MENGAHSWRQVACQSLYADKNRQTPFSIIVIWFSLPFSEDENRRGDEGAKRAEDGNVGDGGKSSSS